MYSQNYFAGQKFHLCIAGEIYDKINMMRAEISFYDTILKQDKKKSLEKKGGEIGENFLLVKISNYKKMLCS